MLPITAAEAREYLAGLALANDREIEELRQTPVELKLRQIWSLMGSHALLGDDIRREAEILEVRERWARLYVAQRG